MGEDAGDWGLLSIADILDTDIFRKAEVPLNIAVSLNDLEIPLLPCESSYAERYIQLLIRHSRYDAEQRTSNVEEVDAFRSARLKRSLAASELIREKLLGAVESFALTVQNNTSEPNFLGPVVSLASLICPDVSSLYEALIEGTESMALTVCPTTDVTSCFDVIQSFKSKVNLGALTEEQRGRLFSAEFSLALRCGKLSTVVRCLLQKSTEEGPKGSYCPPPLEHSVVFINAKTNSFLTRVCELPIAVHATPVYCFPSDERLFVCTGAQGFFFDQLGLMGTRFRIREEFILPSGNNGRLILCNDKEQFFISRAPSTMGNPSYTVQKCDRATGRISFTSRISFLFKDTTAATRDVFFDICGTTLTCLVCSKSSRISSSKCYVFVKNIDSVLATSNNEFHVTSNEVLKRGSTPWKVRRKCYYFTRGNAVSVGRVTLKENFHPFTIELWVYPCNASDNQTIISIGDKNVDEILIEIEPTSEGILWRGGSRTPCLGASFVSFPVSGKLAFCQRWWHVALIFKGSSWSLWVDDAIVAHAPALLSPEPITDAECCLGKTLVGCLTEVRIWNCCRTTAQLHRDSRRSLTTFEPSLIGYYPLDEGEGDVIADYGLNGCHALLHNGHATWSSVNCFPVASPDSVRCIHDFAPIAWRESSGDIFLTSCPGYIAIATPTDGPSVTICEYTTCDLRLVFQARVELPIRTLLKGVAYNMSQHSLVCFASAAEHPKRLLMWEIHQQYYFPFLKTCKYESIWECEKDLLAQCAAYARRLVGAERCLVDQLSWSVQVPRLVVDTSDGLLSSLLRLIHTLLLDNNNDDYVRNLCALLHANLLCRVEKHHEGLSKEIGFLFPDAQSLIKAAQSSPQAPNARDELLRLSFQESFFDTGLLSMTCRCLLSDKSRIAFIRSQSGRVRITEKEDMLFRCLLEYYKSLQASTLLIANLESSQLFCTSLMTEEVFQVDRWLAGRSKALESVKRTSYCLEVFQEILLAKAVEKPQGEYSNFASSYAKFLLRTSEKIMSIFSNALRLKGDCYNNELITCMELSTVGSLLPSFTVALPLLSTSVQASCVSFLKGCREALFSLTDVFPRRERLLYELGVALTSALCRIGCSLLVSVDVVTTKVEPKYLHLLWGGICKAGSERDVIIKNLQQGVGSISRVMDELHREDPGALHVVRDDRLVKLERALMAAFCALLVPTESLKHATKQILTPVFRYVHNMRTLVLSKRQESRSSLDVLEHRALFLARFEPICRLRTEFTPRFKASAKDVNPERKWKRFFQSWKALRVLKAKLPQQRETEAGDPGAVIVQFLQDKDIDRDVLDRLVSQHTQRAQYRLSGMLLIRQLIEEARSSDTLAGIVLPVLTKAFTGWHYADDVQCCSKEEFLRLYGVFFQLLEFVVAEVKNGERNIWADVLLALLTSELRVIDFRRMRKDVTLTLCSLWKFEKHKAGGLPRLNGNVPEHLRNTMLSASAAAPALVVGRSGCTIKGLGGRGTCVVPCEWSLGRKNVSYYFEVLIVDLYTGGSCCVGVGPSDYSVSRLPGWDSESYAIQSEEGTLYEGNMFGRPLGSTFGVGDVMGCGWNTETMELYWTKNGNDIVTSLQVAHQQLYPLIGMSGRGLVKVNFGAERFMFNRVSGSKSPRRGLGERALDVFRVFSLRAALGLVELYSRSRTQTAEATPASELLDGLQSTLGQCLGCICMEVERTLLLLPASEMFVVSLCAHLTILAKLLVSVRDDLSTPCVQRVTEVLQKATHYALRHHMCTSKLRCTLMTTWFAFMNLAPAVAIKEDGQVPGFLDTLLDLGRKLEWSISQRPVSLTEYRVVDEAWTALALLQHMNSETPSHRWSEGLHSWIMQSLEDFKSGIVNTSLVLRILHGSPRLAVPGDRVVVQKSKYTKIMATVVDYSLDDEVCDIIENEAKRQTVSLRKTEITVGDDASAFPQTGNKLHELQMEQVIRVAQSFWIDGGLENGLIRASLQSRILSILWKCVRKRFLALPNELFPLLAKLCDGGESPLDEHKMLMQDKLVIEYCLLGRVLNGITDSSYIPNSNGGDSSVVVYMEENSTRETRTQLAQELSMRGYNLDLCFLALDETNNDLQAALQLLGDHHGDFMSAQRRMASSSTEDDDISSDDGEIDTTEYDVHVLFPVESDDGMDEVVSSVHCDPLNDGIRFLGGYVYVKNDQSFGDKFTIDMQLYLFDVTVTQVVFHQMAASGGWQLIARVQNSSIQCGWMRVDDESPSLCIAPIEFSDTLRWMQLTVVQKISKFSLYKGGVLQSEMEIPFKGMLLESTFCLGGHAESEDTPLNGGMKDICFFGFAVTKEEMGGLTTLYSIESSQHQFIKLDCSSDSIRAIAKDPGFGASVTVVGAVTCFDQPRRDGRLNDVCQQEIEFTTQTGDGAIFIIDTMNEVSSFTTIWRRRRDQRREQLLVSLSKLDKQLASYYAVAILTEMMLLSPARGVCLTPEQVHRMVRFAVNSNDAGIIQSLSVALKHLSASEDARVLNYAMEELVDVVQKEQKMLVFESSHPFKSTSGTAHEVYVPGRREYELHFDMRCSSTSMLVTFYADHTLSSVIAQTPGYALNPICIRASRFFFDVRMDTNTTQWGYKVIILYDFSAPRFAAGLLRTMISPAIIRDVSSMSFVKTSEFLQGMAIASKVNVGRTRCLVLSCLTDLFLHASEYIEPMPQVARMHDLRRMSERLFRRTLGSQHLHSHFVQAVSEFYVALMDAEHCWRAIGEGGSKLCDWLTDAATDTDRFLQKRVEQRNLYKQREGLRVGIEKAFHPESLRVGVNPNKTILVWSECSGSSFIADMPLGSGRWYFELRMMATGDVFIGVLPSRLHNRSDMPLHETFVGFNGKTGTYHGVRDAPLTPRRIWKAKDYVGVVMDGVQKTCFFLVNGYDTGLYFHFGANEAEAVAATGSDIREEREISYHPFFSLEEEEGITINFGGSHFEYEPPRNCFPLDPTNLTLGTLIPYNQLRAFHDLASYIVTAGRSTLPSFFHEEANPFENSTERFGPPHVSLHSTAGMQVNLLLVRNTGLRFATVRANCRVTGGRWYYEVTLRSQGLMQIGWCSSEDAQDRSVGDTPVSWSVDLFRRVKWHDGKPEPLTASRRWAVGDVIGCALDLVERKMLFLCNGRLLSDATLGDSTFTGLPTTLAYEPAVSMRAGNEVLFNFGSTNFKSKPEGFCALGVPDSWNERMDAFYSTLRPSTTLVRLRALRELWLSADQLATHSTLKLYHTVINTVEEYCRNQNKNFPQVTKEVCVELFRDLPIPVHEAWDAYKVLVAFSRVAQGVIPFLHLDTCHPNISTKLFLACRGLLFVSFRNEMVDNILRETNVRAEHFRVSINRMKSRANKSSWMSSIFGQTFSLVADQNPRIFRTNRRFWSVVFLGEGSEDVGGPFREHIGEMCRELMSTFLPLFVPTANNLHNTGTYRDAFVPAASAIGDAELAAFVFIGRLMGGALRSSEPLSLFFPPIIWKFLCFNPIVESDIDDVDRLCLQCIREFRNLKSHVGSSDMFDEVFDSETFTTRLSDGSVKELIPGGATTRVTFERCEEYANALLAVRFSEFTLQLQKMREGLLNVVPETVLCLLEPSELELRICGKPDYTVEELCEGTVYEGLTSDDRRVQFLWQALEDATALQRRLFLRFVSGRDRLPVKLRVLPLSTTGDADSVLPRAATCFFALELPDYSSLKVLKARLYYSIENCADIDTDFNPREVDESEAPHLMVGMEDTRQEEVDSATLSD